MADKVEMLNVHVIRIDPRCQQRAKTRVDAAVQRYANTLADPEKQLPPIRVYKDADSGVLIVVDGHQRLDAYKEAGRMEIPAIVVVGTMREAIFESTGCNVTNGEGLTFEDMKKAALVLLEDPEWRLRMSDMDIHRQTGISASTAKRLREDILSRQKTADPGTRTVTRGGTTYPMNTASIGGRGKRKKDKPTTDAIAEPSGATEANPEPSAVIKAAPLIDDQGQPVPDAVRAAFIGADAGKVLCAKIAAITAEVEAFLSTPAGVGTIKDSVLAPLKNARSALRVGRPAVVCPHCGGESLACSACNGRGWFSEMQHKSQKHADAEAEKHRQARDNRPKK